MRRTLLHISLATVVAYAFVPRPSALAQPPARASLARARSLDVSDWPRGRSIAELPLALESDRLPDSVAAWLEVAQRARAQRGVEAFQPYRWLE
jgi:hypothetical protein